MPESMPSDAPSETDAPPVAPVKETTRDADVADAPPSYTITGRGPMDQLIPDVAPNSTPATRRDD